MTDPGWVGCGGGGREAPGGGNICTVILMSGSHCCEGESNTIL